MKFIAVVIACIAIVGCTIGKGLFPNTVWNNTEAGKIEGKINIVWDGDRSGKFIFVPDQKTPFSFVRMKDGEEIDRITPNKAFYTDGGSIPRAAHVSKNYSPWKFCPAIYYS